MLRQLQVIRNKNIDAQYKVSKAMKRGTLVTKDYVNKQLVPATSLEGLYILDRGLITSVEVDAFGTPSDYADVLETVKTGEFGLAVPPLKGERYAVTEFDEKTDLPVDTYLTVADGKLIKSETPTILKSLGLINDNGHKLLAFEVLSII